MFWKWVSHLTWENENDTAITILNLECKRFPKRYDILKSKRHFKIKYLRQTVFHGERKSHGFCLPEYT